MFFLVLCYSHEVVTYAVQINCSGLNYGEINYVNFGCDNVSMRNKIAARCCENGERRIS